MDKYSERRAQPHIFGYYLPVFQRPFVWPVEKQQKFVESNFLGYDLGRLVVSRHDQIPEFDNWLIDGQQRLTTLKHFIENKFSIFNDIYFDDMKNLSYPKGYYEFKREKEVFQIKPYDHFREIHMPMLEVEPESMNQLMEMYNRLNFGGVTHTEEQLAVLEP